MQEKHDVLLWIALAQNNPLVKFISDGFLCSQLHSNDQVSLLPCSFRRKNVLSLYKVVDCFLSSDQFLVKFMWRRSFSEQSILSCFLCSAFVLDRLE